MAVKIVTMDEFLKAYAKKNDAEKAFIEGRDFTMNVGDFSYVVPFASLEKYFAKSVNRVEAIVAPVPEKKKTKDQALRKYKAKPAPASKKRGK